MIGIYRYHKTVPQNAQVNFYEEKNIIVSNAVRQDPSVVEVLRTTPQSLNVEQQTNGQGYKADTEMQTMPTVSGPNVSSTLIFSAPVFSPTKQHVKKEGCFVM